MVKKLKLHVKKQSGCELKKLITDGEGEYISMKSARYCNDEGIKHEVIAHFTPQHNDTVERRNRRILNMTRSILKAK